MTLSRREKIIGISQFTPDRWSWLLVLICLLFVFRTNAQSQLDTARNNVTISTQKAPGNNDPQQHEAMEIYGFIMTNIIYDFKQMDPNWYDAPRPTKLPAYKDQFGPDGQIYFSMRQTRFGVRGYTPTPFGTVKTLFEFDLFGSGADAGQTTFHLRHAYGELGKFGAGQTWSTFMDPDIIPNSMEYWGPNGMAFIRNLMVRYTPIQGDNHLAIALEKPGASSDEGIYADRIELANVKPEFKLPDLSAEYRYARSWGYIELAGIISQLKWKDLDTIGANVSGEVTAWGLNLSSGIHFTGKNKLHLQVVYGEGIESYMRDAPTDVAIKTKNGISLEGVALPVLGIDAFYDHYWSKEFTSTIGFSSVNITNANGQKANAFKTGYYGLADIIYYPVENVLVGMEFHYLKRINFSDGWSTTDPRVQFSFRYNFSKKIYHEANTTP